MYFLDKLRRSLLIESDFLTLIIIEINYYIEKLLFL